MLKSLIFVIAAALAHGGHGTETRPKDISWQEWHMKEEHQVDSFDPQAFFRMHDLQSKGYWLPNDLLYVYGLSREEVVGDGSGMGEHSQEEVITQEAKNEVMNVVMNLLDKNHDGKVTMEEWLEFSHKKNALPDFGYGPGHHMDFENEYETHHWNKYHRDQDPNVHIKHKEDIEHELLHHDHEIEGTHGNEPWVREAAKKFKSPVNIKNVPAKYLA